MDFNFYYELKVLVKSYDGSIMMEYEMVATKDPITSASGFKEAEEWVLASYENCEIKIINWTPIKDNVCSPSSYHVTYLHLDAKGNISVAWRIVTMDYPIIYEADMLQLIDGLKEKHGAEHCCILTFNEIMLADQPVNNFTH